MDSNEVSDIPALFNRALEKQSNALALWTTIVILAVLNITTFTAIIIRATDELRIQYIPDDAFYYLTLARNYAALGSWTFDSGVSVTSGFHLLFAYLLASAYSILPLDEGNFVLVGVISSLLITIVFIGVMWFWGFRQKSILFLLFLVIIISSRNFTYNAVSVTEWALVILFASLYFVWFFLRNQDQKRRAIDILLLFFLGLLGSLARSDFVLLPLSIAVGALVISKSRSAQLFALTGLVGSITGLLFGFAHSYFYTGSFVQSSVLMKAYWGQVAPVKIYVPPLLLVRALGVAGFLLLAILVIFFVLTWLAGILDGRTQSEKLLLNFFSRYAPTPETLSPNERRTYSLLIISAGICILGYFILYSRSGSVQPWYTANLIVPVLMLVLGISGFISSSISDKIWIFLLLLFLTSVVLNISSIYPVSPYLSPYPHQLSLLNAGNFLKGNLPDRKVGAWNAGIIGYFEGGHIINLDGLVNNDIYEYAVENNLQTYLESRDICCIVDFANMLTEESLRIRGGYNDISFLETLQPQKVFAGGKNRWKDLTFYQINKDLIPD